MSQLIKAASPRCETALYCHYSRAPGFFCSVVVTAHYNYVWFGLLLMGIQILRLAEFTVSVPVLIRFITGWCSTFLCLKNSEAVLTSWFLISSVWCPQMQWMHYFHHWNGEQMDLVITQKSLFSQNQRLFPIAALQPILLHNLGAHLKILKPAANHCFWTLVWSSSWEVREPPGHPPCISFGFLRIFFFFSKHAVPIPGTIRGQHRAVRRKCRPTKCCFGKRETVNTAELWEQHTYFTPNRNYTYKTFHRVCANESKQSWNASFLKSWWLLNSCTVTIEAIHQRNWKDFIRSVHHVVLRCKVACWTRSALIHPSISGGRWHVSPSVSHYLVSTRSLSDQANDVISFINKSSFLPRVPISWAYLALQRQLSSFRSRPPPTPPPNSMLLLFIHSHGGLKERFLQKRFTLTLSNCSGAVRWVSHFS